MFIVLYLRVQVGQEGTYVKMAEPKQMFAFLLFSCLKLTNKGGASPHTHTKHIQLFMAGLLHERQAKSKEFAYEPFVHS